MQQQDTVMQLELPVLGKTVDVDGKFATIQEKFEAFHEANPAVYSALVRLARTYKRRGQQRGSITQLFEVLRFSASVSTSDGNSGFKLNNNYRSRYARLIMKQEEDLADLFEIRERRAA